MQSNECDGDNNVEDEVLRSSYLEGTLNKCGPSGMKARKGVVVQGEI